MPRTGRPRIEIRQDIFEGLCRIQCTKSEICAFLQVSEPTLGRWVKRTYSGRTFDSVLQEKGEAGKISLRRAQLRMAETNPTMAIWCGKQYLGQTDRIEIDHRIESEIESELRRLAQVASAGQTEIPRAAETDTDAGLIN